MNLRKDHSQYLYTFVYIVDLIPRRTHIPGAEVFRVGADAVTASLMNAHGSRLPRRIRSLERLIVAYGFHT